MNDLIVIQQLIIVFLAVILFIVSFSNLIFFRRLKENKDLKLSKNSILVSVLIPARDEESKIFACLNSIIMQTYTNIEVLVLDDHSQDQTSNIVKGFIDDDSRVNLIESQALPKGWVGKHWACHQLSSIASGDLLLFVDADTVLGSQVIENAVAEVEKDRIDLLTLLPNRLRQSFVDKLIYPFIDWSILCFLPVKLAHLWKNPYLSFTFGQFMLFRKSAYLQIGGYEAIHDNLLDDIELGRRIKRNKLKWRLLDGSKEVVADMYSSSKQTIDGISRSIFPVFAYRISLFVLAWILLLSLCVLPLFTIGVSLFGGVVDPFLLKGSYISVGVITLTWFFVAHRFRYSVLIVFCYPLVIGVTLFVALRSVINIYRDDVVWKGRETPRKKLRL